MKKADVKYVQGNSNLHAQVCASGLRAKPDKTCIDRVLHFYATSSHKTQINQPAS